jgi:hypothetical protein
MQQSAVRNQQEDHQIAKSSIQEDNIQMQKCSGQIQPLGRDISQQNLPQINLHHKLEEK